MRNCGIPGGAPTSYSSSYDHPGIILVSHLAGMCWFSIVPRRGLFFQIGSHTTPSPCLHHPWPLSAPPQHPVSTTPGPCAYHLGPLCVPPLAPVRTTPCPCPYHPWRLSVPPLIPIRTTPGPLCSPSRRQGGSWGRPGASQGTPCRLRMAPRRDFQEHQEATRST
jgi:hypothetical protein